MGGSVGSRPLHLHQGVKVWSVYFSGKKTCCFLTARGEIKASGKGKGTVRAGEGGGWGMQGTGFPSRVGWGRGLAPLGVGVSAFVFPV